MDQAFTTTVGQLGRRLRQDRGGTVIMLFGLTLIAVIAAKDFLKGLIAGFRGCISRPAPTAASRPRA